MIIVVSSSSWDGSLSRKEASGFTIVCPFMAEHPNNMRKRMVSRLVRVSSMGYASWPDFNSVKTKKRFSVYPPESVTSRWSITTASQNISVSVLCCCGCMPKRTHCLPFFSKGSTEKACKQEVRAPVSIFCLDPGYARFRQCKLFSPTNNHGFIG